MVLYETAPAQATSMSRRDLLPFLRTYSERYMVSLVYKTLYTKSSKGWPLTLDLFDQYSIARAPAAGDVEVMGWQNTSGQDGPISGETLGDRILSAVKRAGITKQALADRVGKRWGTVNNWCKGSTEPGAQDIRRIAEATGVTVEELLGIADGQTPSFPAWEEFTRSAVWETLSDDQRRTLAGIPWRGCEPTLESYLVAAAAVRSATPRTRIRAVSARTQGPPTGID